MYCTVPALHCRYCLCLFVCAFLSVDEQDVFILLSLSSPLFTVQEFGMFFGPCSCHSQSSLLGDFCSQHFAMATSVFLLTCFSLCDLCLDLSVCTCICLSVCLSIHLSFSLSPSLTPSLSLPSSFSLLFFSLPPHPLSSLPSLQ